MYLRLPMKSEANPLCQETLIFRSAALPIATGWIKSISFLALFWPLIVSRVSWSNSLMYFQVTMTASADGRCLGTHAVENIMVLRPDASRGPMNSYPPCWEHELLTAALQGQWGKSLAGNCLCWFTVCILHTRQIDRVKYLWFLISNYRYFLFPPFSN